MRSATVVYHNSLAHCLAELTRPTHLRLASIDFYLGGAMSIVDSYIIHQPYYKLHLFIPEAQRSRSSYGSQCCSVRLPAVVAGG